MPPDLLTCSPGLLSMLQDLIAMSPPEGGGIPDIDDLLIVQPEGSPQQVCGAGRREHGLPSLCRSRNACRGWRRCDDVLEARPVSTVSPSCIA